MSDLATKNELGTLSAKQRVALAALVTGASPDEAAQAAGVNRTTVYRWQRDPVFGAALRELDGETLRNLGRRVMALGETAAKAFADALAEDQPMSIRLRAADLVTSRGPALAELTTIIERLEALEANREDDDENDA